MTGWNTNRILGDCTNFRDTTFISLCAVSLMFFRHAKASEGIGCVSEAFALTLKRHGSSRAMAYRSSSEIAFPRRSLSVLVKRVWSPRNVIRFTAPFLLLM